jgi:RNA polymerase sigma factor (sigma-70 family)
LARRGRSDGAIPESSYELPDRSDEVVRALLRLSPKQRAAVVLHHYAGYPVKDIAKMLDSTTAAVKVHLSQGRKRLRSLLDEEVPGGA